MDRRRPHRRHRLDPGDTAADTRALNDRIVAMQAELAASKRVLRDEGRLNEALVVEATIRSVLETLTERAARGIPNVVKGLAIENVQIIPRDSRNRISNAP